MTFQNGLPPEAVRAAAEGRAVNLADTQTVGPEVLRVAVLGMSVAARVKQSPADFSTLLARVSHLASLSGGHELMWDVAADAVFLIISGARFDWALHDAGQKSR